MILSLGLCAIFCTPCYVCILADEMNESKWSLCCGNLVAFRTKIRTERKIEGSICYDSIALGLCGLCALCQMRREVKATKPLI